VVKSSGGGKTAANQNMGQALDIFLKYLILLIVNRFTILMVPLKTVLAFFSFQLLKMLIKLQIYFLR
jgi:hypothetical protein